MKHNFRANLASKSELQDSEKSASEVECAIEYKQTIKEVTTIRPAISSNNMRESDGHNETSNAIIEAQNQPYIKVPSCYSVRQIDVLQKQGNYTFASQYETDEFLQQKHESEHSKNYPTTNPVARKV